MDLLEDDVIKIDLSGTCSAASLATQEPMFATTAYAEAWLLVEVPGAWGRDAFTDSALAEHLPPGWAKALQQRAIRPLCVRDQSRPRTGPFELTFAVVSIPGRRAAALWRTEVTALADVARVTEQLSVDDAPHGWTATDQPVIAVCTNGRRDQCCATAGRPALRALSERTNERVWECSHLGGHRFAATFLDLPSGLCFGRCNEASAIAVIEALRSGLIDAEHFRGRSSVTEPAQAAEYFARRHLDAWGLDDVRSVDLEDSWGGINPGADSQGQIWVIGTAASTVRLRLRSTKEPMSVGVSCGALPGEPTTRYAATDFVITHRSAG